MPVSEQVSGTHGPAEDDAIKRQDRTDLQAHGEQWPDRDSDDEEPDAAWAPEGRFAGTPPGEDWPTVELRSDLARHLDRTAFPAAPAKLIKILATHQADQRLIDLVRSLPRDTKVASLAELLSALGLPLEERAG
jgi:hypothetical protein